MGLSAAKKKDTTISLFHTSLVLSIFFTILTNYSLFSFFWIPEHYPILIPLSRLWGEAWRGALSFGGSILPWSKCLNYERQFSLFINTPVIIFVT